MSAGSGQRCDWIFSRKEAHNVWEGNDFSTRTSADGSDIERVGTVKNLTSGWFACAKAGVCDLKQDTVFECL